MSAHRPVQRDDTHPHAGFDALEIGRLTWIGLIVAGLGWALLLGEATVADVLPGRGARGASSLHADLVEIAKCVIGSGFAVAFIGALHSGFGTLNRFFAAVLMRSSQRTVPVTATPVEAAQTPPREAHPYRTLADGSVEVETIFGTRRFATMREAAELI